MKTQFLIRGLNVNADSRRWLEQSLGLLQKIVSISDAAIVLERRRDDTPPFRAYVSLAVPGPDIHAEARDHTLEAVWLKVTSSLRKQIAQRKSRQHARAEAANPDKNVRKVKQGMPRIYNRVSLPAFSGAS